MLLELGDYEIVIMLINKKYFLVVFVYNDWVVECGEVLKCL